MLQLSFFQYICLFLAVASPTQSFSGSLHSRRHALLATSRLPLTVESSGTEIHQEQESADFLTMSTTKLPPVIQQIADERREYQVNLGKAMDVLRRDMQEILTKRPDFSIYDEQITVVDPSGVQLQGLERYKSAFSFFQTFVSFWFRPKASGVQFRMVYDFARSSIRISWHAVLSPKVNLLGGSRPLFIDGISYYQLDRASGKVTEHRIENLMINNSPVEPPYGILSLLQQDALRLTQPRGVPVGVGALTGGFQ